MSAIADVNIQCWLSGAGEWTVELWGCPEQESGELNCGAVREQESGQLNCGAVRSRRVDS